ncbi:hypothetical protein GCM10027271_04360 [Saccharopolyspora gloriosae]|uniref:Uncharacterized protein n=1 Tax=Saccharopolyspora gloriosae TaxID=455344 RepID=A0A840NPS9_9PSEU|nr:DUF6350 family protein [Saccharopolyspora gloriosae]MBB5071985.1 hypothetical protein [Saccharopolyspora gloriosae]
MPLIESLPDPDLVPEPDEEHRDRIGARRLGLVVVTTTLIGYLLAATLLALATGTARGADVALPALLAAAVPGWLAAHQVPLLILGAPLSVLPFLPTIALGLLIAAITAAFLRRYELSGARDAVRVIGVVGFTHAVLGAALAALLGGVVDASVPGAFLRCGLIAAAASAAGACRYGELLAALRRLAGPTISAGLRGGLLAWACLLGAGALVAVIALFLSAPRVGDLLSRADSAGDVFGMLLLSLLYLPNAMVAGWSFAAGPGIGVGELAVRFYGTSPGPVPEFPLLVALPPGDAAWWWSAVVLLPVAAGVFVGVRCGRDLGGAHRSASVALAALVAASGVLVVAAATGGSAGGGGFDPISLHPVLSALVTFGWVLVPALPAMWLFPADPASPAAESDAEAPPEPDVADEVVDEVADDAADDSETADDSDEDDAENDADEDQDAPELEEVDLEADEFDVDEAEWADLVLRAQQADAAEPVVSWSGDLYADEGPAVDERPGDDHDAEPEPGAPSSGAEPRADDR